MSISQDPLEAARQALEPGETLVWAERPDPQALARSKLPQILRGWLGLAAIAGLLWYVFLPHWPAGNSGLVLAVSLAAAVLYCLWLIVAQVVAKAAAGRMVYAVTDRRLLILEAWPLSRQHAFTPPEFDEIQVMIGESGRGTVVFIYHKLPWWRRSAGGSYQVEAFYGIADVQRVADEIEKLKAGTAPDRLPDEET